MHNAATLMLHMWWSPLCKDLPTFFWYAVKIIQESASGASQNKLHFSLHSVWNAACIVMPVSLVGKSKYYQNSVWQHLVRKSPSVRALWIPLAESWLLISRTKGTAALSVPHETPSIK